MPHKNKWISVRLSAGISFGVTLVSLTDGILLLSWLICTRAGNLKRKRGSQTFLSFSPYIYPSTLMSSRPCCWKAAAQRGAHVASLHSRMPLREPTSITPSPKQRSASQIRFPLIAQRHWARSFPPAVLPVSRRRDWWMCCCCVRACTCLMGSGTR